MAVFSLAYHIKIWCPGDQNGSLLILENRVVNKLENTLGPKLRLHELKHQVTKLKSKQPQICEIDYFDYRTPKC